MLAAAKIRAELKDSEILQEKPVTLIKVMINCSILT
jgi:hypothetical protein